MTTVSALQTYGPTQSATLSQTQKALLGTLAPSAATGLTQEQTGTIPALSFPPASGSAPAVPPGRFENPGRQQGVLEFGPSPGVSALTRIYTSTGQLVPQGPSAVDLFAQPVRGINYLA